MRNGSVIPERIVAPFGQETTLETQLSTGWLTALENPATERFEMTYSAGGLPESFENPEQHVTSFTNDALGQPERVEDALPRTANEIYAFGKELAGRYGLTINY